MEAKSYLPWGLRSSRMTSSLFCPEQSENEMLLTELGVPLGSHNKRGCCTGWRCQLEIDERTGGIESPVIL